MIDTKPLKQKWANMEDSTAKELVLSLPNEISEQDLLSKMDLVLPFLDNKREARS